MLLLLMLMPEALSAAVTGTPAADAGAFVATLEMATVDTAPLLLPLALALLMLELSGRQDRGVQSAEDWLRY